MALPNGLGRISVQILALRFNVLGHSTLTGLFFTSKYDRRNSYMMTSRLKCWKPDLVEIGFPPFLAPLLQFLREMGQNEVSGQVLLRFAPFLSQ